MTSIIKGNRFSTGETDIALIHKVESNRAGLFDLCKKLIAFRSINPPGDEREISNFIAEYMKELGLKVQLISTGPKRANVMGVLEGRHSDSSPKAKEIFFNGHMDVVPVGDIEEWTGDPFEARLKDNRVIGRGASDMKGAIAACLISVKSIVDCGLQLEGDLQVHAVADEENGSEYGTRYLISKGLIKSDMGVVMEGSVFAGKIHVRPAVRGLHWIEIQTKGRAIHGSRPGDGINAILKMSKILLALDKYEVKFPPHRLLPAPTIAAGTMITGGVRENVIPPKCSAIVDLRVLPGMTEQDNLDQINSVINSLTSNDDEIKASASTRFWWPPAEINEEEPIVNIAKEAGQIVTGYPIISRGSAGSNDSTFLNEFAHVPTIAFGPSDIKVGKSHGADEWVDMDILSDFSKIYALMATMACSPS